MFFLFLQVALKILQVVFSLKIQRRNFIRERHPKLLIFRESEVLKINSDFLINYLFMIKSITWDVEERKSFTHKNKFHNSFKLNFYG